MNKKSGIALLCCYVLIVASAFFYPKWKQSGTEATISWDASGYYWYLPSLFIYKDIKHFEFHDSIIKKYNPTWDFQQAYPHPSGNYVMKYACGQAITMLPWFGLAHVWAKNSTSYPPDGFSYPYQFMICWGMILYAFLGLWILRKLLLRYFKDITTSLVLLAIVFGSNYLDFAGIDNGMTHSSLFTLYALLLFVLDSFYKSPDMRSALLIGLLSGLAVLVRPTEAVVLILVGGWGITSISDLRYRFRFILEHKQKMMVAACCFLLIVFIQPLYWKYASGDWIVYSYGDQGFDWFHPHVKNFAFSGKMGWLRFTPMMIFAMIGMLFVIWDKQSMKVVCIFFAITYYITTAWSIWDYGGNGGRAMIQYYPILSFAMASFFEKIHVKRLALLFFIPIFLLFIYLNLWYTYHAHKGKLRVINSSDAYFWKTVGRWEVPLSYLKLITNPYMYEGHPKDSLLLYQNNFDQDSASNNLKSMNGNKYYELTMEHPFDPPRRVANRMEMKEWVRIWAWIGCSDYEGNEWLQTTMNIRFIHRNSEVSRTFIQPQMFIEPNKGEWINMDVKPPKEWDSLEVFFRNRGSRTALLVDSLRIVTFNEK